jgi:hypothetical protein
LSRRTLGAPPLIGLATFNLDFLCIHPFRDGNGRVPRLLWLLQSYHLGYEVGRYISLERVVEQNKDRYYETLEQSSQGWHEGKHDPWPYINYVLYILKAAYKEFAERVGEIKEPRGAKTAHTLAMNAGFNRPFSLMELEGRCPGISRDMLRRLLRDEQQAGRIECLGKGSGALWSKTGGKEVIPLKGVIKRVITSGSMLPRRKRADAGRREQGIGHVC